MPTLRQIEHGATHYDLQAGKAHYEASYLEKLGSQHAAEWKLKAEKYEQVAKSLRALATE